VIQNIVDAFMFVFKQANLAWNLEIVLLLSKRNMFVIIAWL